ncbi:MAG: TrkH family potassium uptake protein, partial [Candidatus Omnitrophica bacterium]|nr:TrkH family potassium uptake protein [Candidatus Omnitrophota bacterium]
MILKPRLEDIKIIGFYLGKIILGIALTMLLPIFCGLAFGEINPALDFIVGIEVAIISGMVLINICRTDKDLNWMQGMIVVSLSWLVAMVL